MKAALRARRRDFAIREFVIVASGDILPHDLVIERARQLGGGEYDFRPMFARLRPLVAPAALAICHLEVPIGAGRASGYPIFNSPGELADALAWTGWDVCTTASNHTADRGLAGVVSTVRSLERAGVAPTGSFCSRADSRRPLIVTVKGLRIAVLAYTYGLNVVPEPAPPWAVNLISRRRIEADAARARRLGADLVIASLHWGEEYDPEPSNEQRQLAGELLEPGTVDLILGQHAHVVQPIEEIGGRFVVFGTGTMLARLAEHRIGCRDGLLAVIRVSAGVGRARVTRVDYVPTWVRPPTFVIEPAGYRLRRLLQEGRSDDPEAAALAESYRRTVRFAGRGPRTRPLPELPPSVASLREESLEARLT